jgi:hypothetical protein
MITISAVQSFMSKQAYSLPFNVTRSINIGTDKLGFEPEDRAAMTMAAIPGTVIGSRLMANRGAFPRIAGGIGGGLLAAALAPALVAGVKKALASKTVEPSVDFYRGGIDNGGY